MANISLIFASLLLFFSAEATLSTATSSEQSYGLCSQVFLMHQYCTSQLSSDVSIDDTNLEARSSLAAPRIGKAGPRGLKGDRGDPGIVNYTAINRKISAKFEEYEARIDKKVDRWEKFLNSENQKMKLEIENLKNETEKRSKAIERNRIKLREFSQTSCKHVTQDNGKVWNGTGGVFNIFRGGHIYEVYCDMITDGGGWTVFQRRMDGSVDFYRTWEEYAAGFGNKAGEFWLGLENIYQLTLDGDYELRVDLTDWDGRTGFARYGTFSISGRSDNYRLTIGDYSGTAGDSMTQYDNGRAFTARDRDLDLYSSVNCAEYSFGAWWFYRCGYANLNGRYNDTSGDQRGVFWYHWKNIWRYSLKASEIKFRKK